MSLGIPNLLPAALTVNEKRPLSLSLSHSLSPSFGICSQNLPLYTFLPLCTCLVLFYLLLPLSLSLSLCCSLAMARSAPALPHNNHLLFSSSTTKNFGFLFNSHFHCSVRLPKPLLSLSSSSSSPSPSPSPGHSHITRVTTAPVEYTLPPPEFDFRREISRLKALRHRLSDCRCLKDKVEVIEGDQGVKSFFNSRRYGFSWFLASMNLSEYELFLLKCLVAAGQEHVLSLGYEFVDSEEESARSSVKSALYALVEMIEKVDVNGGGEGLHKNIGLTLNDEDIGDLRILLKNLGEVEKFYDCIGGIIG